jgi:hypothetical protein
LVFGASSRAATAVEAARPVNAGLTKTYGVVALAIDPSTPATLYAGTVGGGVFRFVPESPGRLPVQRR